MQNLNANPNPLALRGVLSGRVQGVGFRYFVYRRALEADVKGWVKNIFNGDVEIHLEGSRERVYNLRNVVERGPAMANVIECRWKEVPVQGFQNFEITF
jgi:acylphosphatase